jgi:hypothetical protein
MGFIKGESHEWYDAVVKIERYAEIEHIFGRRSGGGCSIACQWLHHVVRTLFHVVRSLFHVELEYSIRPVFGPKTVLIGPTLTMVPRPGITPIPQ